jgi:hypothetical protein
MSLTAIPLDDFQGNANLSEGDSNLASILAEHVEAITSLDDEIASIPRPADDLCIKIDYDAATDAADAVGVGTDPAAALAAAVPFKTIQHVHERVLPLWGNNTACTVLIKPRAGGLTYRNIADTDDDMTLPPECWRLLQVRLTGSDLTDSPDDRVTCGFRTVPSTTPAATTPRAALPPASSTSS